MFRRNPCNGKTFWIFLEPLFSFALSCAASHKNFGIIINHMKLTKREILFISIAVGLAAAVVSGIPRFLWSSPGGSAYGSGFPFSYYVQYCGGYSPCYWTPFSIVMFIADFAIYFIITMAILIVVAQLRSR